MIHRKSFKTQEEAIAFADITCGILDVGYKKTGYRYAGGERVDVFEWVVEWDVPTWEDLHPSRPIEL